MRIRSLFAVLLASVLTVAACGGDSGPSLDDYAAAFVASILADQDEDSLQVDERGAQCIGAAAAAEIGLERLEEVGTPEEVEEKTVDDLAIFDLSDAQALEIADDYLGCVPDVVDQFVESLGLGDAAECVADLIDPADLRPASAAALKGDEVSDAEIAFISDAVGECRSDDLQSYVDVLATSIAADAGPTLGITDDESVCFAENAITVIGEERLAAIGDAEAFTAATEDDLAALDLSLSELQSIASGYFDCSPTTAVNFRKLFLDGTGLAGDQLDCVDGLLTDQILIDIIAASLGGLDPEAGLGSFQEDVAACE